MLNTSVAETKKLFEALRRSQSGDVDGAIVLLEELATEGAPSADALGLHFMLLMRAGRTSCALELCGVALEHLEDPLARSTWLLRRGLMYVERERKNEALDDLQQVIILDASEDHQLTARQALLRISGLSAN